MAELYTHSHEIIALRHCYSGASLLAMNITAHRNWRLAESLVPGIKHAHNAYCFRCAFGREYPHCDLECARDVKELIETTTSGHPSAFIAEPIQGVGGFITPPKEYFKEVVSIVRSYGGLFICDEVQTGWGRTGEKMFGIEHWGVEPDIMVMAKGAANGSPIGITIATPEVADAFKGSHISTFGGNPVTAMAVLATIDVIEKKKSPPECEEDGRLFERSIGGVEGKIPDHRRGPRHGSHPGHGDCQRQEGTGSGSRFRNLRIDEGEGTPDREGWPLRKCHPDRTSVDDREGGDQSGHSNHG